MNIAELFIRRPVMTTLVMLGILMFGIMAYRQLPVSDLPNVDFPTISVTASLPGANPETMASAVATPLERQFTTIAGLDSMISTSALGTCQITLTFNLSRQLDAAAQDVQSAIAKVASQLPRDMPSPPTYQKVNPADQPILYLALTSQTLPLYTLDEYGETNLAQRISTVSGVAQVQVIGSQKYAVRIQLDPRALAARGIGIDEVAQAIQNQNVNLPTGTLYGAHKAFTVQASGQLTAAEDYRPLIVAYRNGSPVRLQELGRVIDSVENDKTAAWFGTPRSMDRAIILAIQRQPGTNTVEIARAVRALLPAFQSELPASVSLNILYDRSVSIEASVNDVKFTLLLTLFLVVLVIFLFLRNLSATVIPSLALPFSIVGTFAVMYALGYNLDNLSLMALTLSVGFVVDDAIVMLENIVRHMEMGEPPLAAALNGSREIGFTILSMTLSLAAVFIPILFMGGLVGRLLHEFAVTIGTAILVSGFVSLTLTPMLGSRFLHHMKGERHGRLYQAFERVFEGSLDVYKSSLAWSLRHKWVNMAGLVVVLVLTGVFGYVIPKGLFPNEDNSQILAFTEGVEGISFESLVEHQKTVAAIVQREPAVEAFLSSAGARGFTGSNQGLMFMHLKPRDQRPPAEALIQQMRPKLSQVAGMRVYLQIPPTIRIGGNLTKSPYQYTLQSADTDKLYQVAPLLESRMRTLPGFLDVTSDLQIKNPEIDIQIQRDKAATLGVTAAEIENVLYDAYGSRQISTIYAPNNEYQVILQALPQYQADPAALSMLYVRSSSGTLVPLNAVASLKQSLGPLTVSHLGQLPAVTISFNLKPGVSLGPGDAAAGRHDQIPGDGAGVPGRDGRPRPAPGDGDPGHLHGARDPLRELHPPDHHPVGAAVRRARGPGDALRLQDVRPVHGFVALCLRRDHHARRAGQEERHHDDRFRDRDQAPRIEDTRGGHLRGLRRPLPADHDDHHGGADGDPADRRRIRRRFRVAPPARSGGRGRPAVLSDHHPVRHAGRLRLPRAPARVARPGIPTRARRGSRGGVGRRTRDAIVASHGPALGLVYHRPFNREENS